MTMPHSVANGAVHADDATHRAYQSGFGNEFASEALAGALPVGRNSPQRPPYGLYAEQLSGTAFTAPRAANRRSWLYRIRPAAVHQPFARIANGGLSGWADVEPTPKVPAELVGEVVEHVLGMLAE